MNKRRRVAVLGDGGWGTCLAVHLSELNHSVTLWGAFSDQIRRIREAGENKLFLPGIRLPEALRLTSDFSEACEEADVLVVAVPCRYLRQTLKKFRDGPWERVLTVSVVKGIEPGAGLRMSELIRQEVPAKRLAVLSGPSISYEVARKHPTTVVAASGEPSAAEETQALFGSERFRVYTSGDVVGVELGGSLKNVIALACGAAEGIGFGTNTKAALASRGLAEMARLGAAMGADPRTFAGLSGLGDLITTCFSPHSRNRTVGERLGKGETLEVITGGMKQVAEGITTARSAVELSRKHRVEMPIAEAVHRVLYEGKDPREAVRELMLRDPKPE